MYFNIESRNSEYRIILRSFIENNYSIKINSIDEHTRGFYGETWKIECNDNLKFFAKIIYFEKQEIKYRKCFRILDYMKENGIDFVSRTIKTVNGKSYISFNRGTLAVFKFAEGIHAEDKPAAFIPYMVKIYNLPRPEFKVEHEDFSADIFLYLKHQMKKLEGNKEILNIVNSNWGLLADISNKLNHFSQLCKKMNITSVITSGDIGGNSLVNNGRITIIDWDWIKLAPPERDFWWYVQDPNQITGINSGFHQENFEYVLDNNILGYYAFFSFIYFLTEIIDSFLYNPVSKPEVTKRLGEYFSEENCMFKCIRNVK